jgi:hypothetical protein
MASSAQQTGGRRWWSGFFTVKHPPVPFEVSCRCGRVLHGHRRRRGQVIPCPACAEPVFVFPRSPWHANGAAADFFPSTGPSPARQAWFRFRTPLIAGGITLAVFVIAFLIVLPFLVRRPAPAQERPRSTATQLNEHLQAGRRALADGAFNVALRELNAAVELRDRQPDLLAPKLSRDLNQLQRQADLLARVHSQPLQELLKEAVLTRNGDDWRVRFDNDHKGKTVIFDDVVRRDPATGKLVLAAWEVRAGSEKAVVALDDLAILHALPLEPPPRLIFGGRLHSLEREAGGVWVIHFEPDSGVPLTDADAVTACWPVPPDGDVLRTLQRQEEWLRDLPAQRQAP